MISKGHFKTRVLTENRLGYVIPKDLLKPFFDFTDKGIKPAVTNKKGWDFIMFAFRLIAYDYNQYIEDFKGGLLFLSDFENEVLASKELALRAYKASMGDTAYYRGYLNRWR